MIVHVAIALEVEDDYVTELVHNDELYAIVDQMVSGLDNRCKVIEAAIDDDNE